MATKESMQSESHPTFEELAALEPTGAFAYTPDEPIVRLEKADYEQLWAAKDDPEAAARALRELFKKYGPPTAY